MPQLVITDIESDGQESSTVYKVADFQEATDALLADLNRTASAEFTDVASHYWAAKGNVAGFAAFEVCLALTGFLGFEQSFQAGDQVVPAFSAVHVQKRF